MLPDIVRVVKWIVCRPAVDKSIKEEMVLDVDEYDALSVPVSRHCVVKV